VVHSKVLNSSDNLPSYPPDNQHSSDEVYWEREKNAVWSQKSWWLTCYGPPTWYIWAASCNHSIIK